MMSGTKLMSKASVKEGDICIVNLPVMVVMVEDFNDQEKLIMQVLSDQTFKHTEETELLVLQDILEIVMEEITL